MLRGTPLGNLHEARRPAQVRAAQYVRMSTEDQAYSVGNQIAAIALYAAEHRCEIVRTYADEGVSGLRIEHREALQQMLRDVLSGEPGYSLILAYDVSRWGRFQDPDEAAHYEFLCRQAGVGVEYCAEAFINDGSLGSTLMKSVKRAMAAEFSRDFGVRMSWGRRRVAQAGFWAGGTPGYGLRRQIVRVDGTRGAVLPHGERKGVQSDRMILVPGPAAEVECVRRIYRLFVVNGLTYTAIARLLNREEVLAEGGGPWTMHRVRQILTSEKYIGTNVYGKVRNPLQGRTFRVPQLEWVRVPKAFEAIVPSELFKIANANIRRHRPSATDEALLDGLRALTAAGVPLSTQAIRDAPSAYCPAVYQRRFGSLSRAYELVGYELTNKQRLAAGRARGRTPPVSRYQQPEVSDQEMLARLAVLLVSEGRLTIRIINDAPGVPSAHKYRRQFGGMRRAYALVGYEPTGLQARSLEVVGGQTITHEAATALAREVDATALILPGPWSLD